MNQTKEFNELFDNIITCGESIAKLCRFLKEGIPAVTMNPPTEEATPEQAEETVPTQPEESPAPLPVPAEAPVKTYSFADVRKLCSTLSHKGHTAKVRELINKYGAAKLSEIKEEDYASLMADLEVI